MKTQFYILLFCAAFLLLSCEQKENKPGLKIIDNKVGLSMVVPSSFSKLDDQTKNEQMQKGKRAIDKLHDSTFVLSDIQNVNMFSHNDNNMFLLNIQNYDQDSQGDYKTAINNANKLLYQTQIKNSPDIESDSVTSKEVIDGIEFMKFTLNTKISENETMHMVNYHRLFNNKIDFTAAVIFTDERLGKKMLKAFKAAKFKK